MTDDTTQLYQVFIKATPERIWAAIVEPDVTEQYFHGARIQNTAERHLSHGPDGSVWGDGPVLEFDPPRRLVHEWRSLYDPDLADESPSRVTWEIEPVEWRRVQADPDTRQARRCAEDRGQRRRRRLDVRAVRAEDRCRDRSVHVGRGLRAVAGSRRLSPATGPARTRPARRAADRRRAR